ncbi:DUF4159 domain-containing protein [Neorhodopirellula pilleata]|uniref:DUF4159 domain-containing protein n=1 Tax=Neorhodopirellula pilleata TaxID=2714738 RepID=A0A5C6AIF1_9BACT|nr:DUF4159 domain-containing protein [Neorhodopirellula pilleata]TWT99028.1 hypothetical protein Pla100_22020 [Neorhodopirellula pilleata]
MFFAFVSIGLVVHGPIAHAAVDALQVQRSIDRGIDYLRKTQTQRGGWNEYGNQSCGLSALCTLAWVNAGVSRQDPDMIRAMEYLRAFRPDETYSVALQTLVFCQVGAIEDLPRIRRNVAWLVEQQIGEGQRFEGAWGYGGGRGNGDPSNAQFAVLALGAASERGIEIDSEVFALASQYWKQIQLPGGGWSYGGPTPSGSMTCAGIASMIICGGSLRDAVGIGPASLQCCGGEELDDTVERGLEALSRRFTIEANPGGELLSYFYYLYAVERVGRLSGRRLIGERDWYREGAERLVGLQDDFDGSWRGGGPVESNRDIATSFALLFLAKGKRQVVIGRLEYAQDDADASENAHPTSLQTLVRHVERSWSRELTWQNISARQAGVEDLLQTPVLVIGGREDLKFDAPLLDRMKEYLDQGGTILFDAQAGDGCGDDRVFRQAVETMCSQWYPNSRLESLPPSHPIWFAERFVDPKVLLDDDGQPFDIEGVQACCRTPVFYSRQSLMCRWSYGGPLLRNEDLSPSIQEQVVAGITIGENLVAYATGRELKDKLDAVNQINAASAPDPTRGAIPIAVAALGAGERQVGQAIPHAAAIIRDKLGIEVLAVDQPIALTDESLQRIGVLYMTGQTEFQLDEVARSALKRFIEREGIVVASPICGEAAFANSVVDALQSIMDGQSFEPLPADHPALGTQFGGYDLSRVEIRRPVQGPGARDGNDEAVARKEPVKVSRRVGSPLIETMSTLGVDNVFYSPLDLSCALESQNSIQCPGYSTEDAAKIIAGLILYGLNQ